MIGLLRAEKASTPALVLLALAAVAMAVGGLEHARLFHRGYGAVEVVGPLFLLNAVGTLVAILLLVFERPTLFVLAGLPISIGSVVSIVISHTTSFFSFAESGYDGAARLIVAAEIAAIVLSAAAVVVGTRTQARP